MSAPMNRTSSTSTNPFVLEIERPFVAPSTVWVRAALAFVIVTVAQGLDNVQSQRTTTFYFNAAALKASSTVKHLSLPSQSGLYETHSMCATV